jgi:small subunit ribosomal protein S6
MRHYEMMVILTDALDEDGATALVERIEGIVRDGGGQVNQTDFWGRRPFAYEIDHRQSGYYAVLDLELPPESIAELERQLKINDDVVRYKLIRPEVRVRRPETKPRAVPM